MMWPVSLVVLVHQAMSMPVVLALLQDYHGRLCGSDYHPTCHQVGWLVVFG
jgi:hypothetical protein